MNQKLKCGCGAMIRPASKDFHLKTAKHKKAMEKKCNNQIEMMLKKALGMENEDKKYVPEMHKEQDASGKEITIIVEDAHELYECERCGFSTVDKKAYGYHFKSSKHKASKYLF
jgi:hypothetical protein